MVRRNVCSLLGIGHGLPLNYEAVNVTSNAKARVVFCLNSWTLRNAFVQTTLLHPNGRADDCLCLDANCATSCKTAQIGLGVLLATINHSSISKRHFHQAGIG